MTQVLNIPLDMIDTAPQVRTKFNQGSIEELAADIKAHGVLQPLVVQQRGQRFRLLIGERRLRACRFNNAATVPAIIASVSTELATEVQLTENIQREDLNVKDLAAAIHTLWKKHGSVAEVAARVKKSPSWVSKRLAIAMDVGVHTCSLMDGNIKDVELLYNFGKPEKINPARARTMATEVLIGKAGREEVKAALLERPDGEKAKPEGQEDTQTMDLFEDDQPTEGSTEKLRIALEALHMIKNAPLSINPADKAHYMRKAALDALEKIGAF